MRLGYVLIVKIMSISYLDNGSEVLHSKKKKKHTTKDRIYCRIHTRILKERLITYNYLMFISSEVYVLISAKLQAGNVLISHLNSRLTFFSSTFFGVRLHCNKDCHLLPFWLFLKIYVGMWAVGKTGRALARTYTENILPHQPTAAIFERSLSITVSSGIQVVCQK